MSQVSGAEAMVRMLKLHGVDVVFGLCGDTSLPFYDALYQDGAGINHVLTRDERHAAYMADAYARVTGRVGVCEGPSGGGATYILPGIVEANDSSIPVLGITTDISVTARGKYTLTELDQQALYRPLTKWNQVIDEAGALPSTARAAFRHMTTGNPGAAHIGLPLDVQRASVDGDDLWADDRLGRFPAWRTAPDGQMIEGMAALLSSARLPMFVCGGGVVISGAEAELLAVAELLDAPVATTISGQGSIADDHPLAVGVVGNNGGTAETRDMVDAADVVVFVGCRAGSVTTDRRRHPAPGAAKICHMDIDPAVIGTNYETAAYVLGDARLCLQSLAGALSPRGSGDSDTRQRIAAAKKRKFESFRALANANETPIRPERIVADLNAVAPPDTVIVADPGTPCPYFSAYYEFPLSGRHFISNRAHGALGFALPAVVGAQYGRPDAACIAIMGDGSFGMAAGELETMVRLNVPVTLIVVSNSVFGWIKAGQKYSFGERFFSVDFNPTNHAAVAEAFGMKAWRVSDPGDLRPALRAAIATDGPTLVDVITRPLHEARAPVSEWIA